MQSAKKNGVTREEMAEVITQLGFAKDSAFQHIAIEVPGENTRNEWCEPVDEKEYMDLP